MKLVVCGVLVLMLTSLVGCSGDDDDDSSSSRSSSSTTHSSSSSSASSTSTTSTTSSGSTGGSQVVAGGFDGSAASFELRGDAETVRITTADLGGNKYRVSLPSAAAASPRAAVHNRDVVVTLEPRSGGTPAAVEITLDDSVTWSIRRDGADRVQTLDLAHGHVSDLEFAGTAQSIDISLPSPTGTVPMRVTGSATSVAVHAPLGVPVQVVFRTGATSVTIDGDSRTDVAPDTLITPPGWDTATDRYDVAMPRVSTFSLDRI